MNSMGMKVSIITPVYNVQDYFRKCVLSLFNQTYDNIQFIFIDDCSKDNSIGILHELMEEYPSRAQQCIIVRHAENMGIASSRNDGLDQVLGDYTMWVDADDWIDENAVEKLVIVASRSNADVVLYDSVSHFPNDKLVEMSFPDYSSALDAAKATISREGPFMVWGRFAKSSLFDGVRALPGSNISEDYLLSAEIMSKATSVENLHLPLYHYNCENQTSCRTKSGESINSQAWKSMEEVVRYFSDKSEEYQPSVNRAVLWCVSCDFTNYAKHRNELHYYNSAIAHLKTIDRRYWSLLPLQRRLLFSLHKSKRLLVMYAKFASAVNSVIKQLKN